jgi:hypothetical protein
MTFKSTSVEKTGDNEGKVTGELTLLGVTKPVSLDVTFNKIAPNPFNKNRPTAGFEAHTAIKRSDFGMKAEIPNMGDEIDILIDAQAPRCSRTHPRKASQPYESLFASNGAFTLPPDRLERILAVLVRPANAICTSEINYLEV